MSRRGLLLAGGAAILAGCGKDEVAGPPPLTEALQRSFAAEEALGSTALLTRIVEDVGEFPETPLLRRIARRSDDRARRAGSALSAAGGRPHDASEAGEQEHDLVLLGRAAVEAHVAALPSLTGRELRALGASLVAESAADLAMLEDVLATTSGGAFPGMPG